MEEEQGPSPHCVCVNVTKTALGASRLVSTQISVLACAHAAQHCPSHLSFCQIQALLKAVGKTQETSFPLCSAVYAGTGWHCAQYTKISENTHWVAPSSLFAKLFFLFLEYTRLTTNLVLYLHWSKPHTNTSLQVKTPHFSLRPWRQMLHVGQTLQKMWKHPTGRVILLRNKR